MSMIKLLFIFVSVAIISYASNIDIDMIYGNAKKENKHVFIFLHKPCCSFCENMIELTLADEKINQKIKKSFIFVDINVVDSGEVVFDEFKGSKREFAKELGFDFYPSSVFIGEDKEIVYGQAGYKDEDQFLNTLCFIQSHAYEKMGIDEYTNEGHKKCR